VLLKFLDWLASGEKTAQDLTELCLQRIAACDGEIRAWVEVAPQEPLEHGRMDGIPFGAKDIFETRGLATEYGSTLYAGRRGTSDAAVITDLRGSGAILLGKTHTSAFASFDPAPTRNPRFRGHTPGGSSAGSAAAVAAGMAPFTLGSQTMGSVLRPASYCGVCGFKPSFGLLPTDGVLAFAPSLDTVGLFTETPADMAALWSRGFGGALQADFHRGAFLALPAEEAMSAAMRDAVDRLRAAGAEVDALEIPKGWNRLLEAARVVNDYEGARTHKARFEQFGESIGTRLAELVKRGLAIPAGRYDEARGTIEEMRGALHAIFWEYPVILSPAATGVAPPGFESTGDPSNNAPWTAAGVPAISVPLPGPLPLGLQLTAAWGRDDALVAVAAHVARLL
jgi:Asp-tRNA(Asn)/Glu-tRNA(Gln) amidotransferase A subunit family amidase